MPLPRYRRATLRQLGRASTRVRPVRRVEYAAVSKRAKGVCELCCCEWERLTGRSLSDHHAFGRGHLPGIPVAHCESRDAIVGLCNNWPPTGHQGCHERIHSGDGALADEARYLALARFCARWNLHLEDLVAEAGPDPVDVMRLAVRRLEERGA